MRIGIVTDIHDAVLPLDLVLSTFRQTGVDQVVSLGDVFDSYRPNEPGAQVARLLAEAGAIGVWGNHDVGLSRDVNDAVRQAADPGLLEVVTSPRF
jgi:predicted phosphodiesterase